jgi:hypothetical protein
MQVVRAPRESRWLVILSFVGVLAGWVLPLDAEAQPRTAAVEGRDAFQRGLNLLRAERWLEAVPELEEAVRAEATPIRWYNLALAYRGAARAAAACDAFDRYLEQPEAGASEARLAAVRVEREALLGVVARVRLRVTPSSAALRVDGREAARVPAELRLDPGVHALEFTAPGHEPRRHELTLRSGGEVTLEFFLLPLPSPPPVTLAAVPSPPASLFAPPRHSPPAATTPRRGWVLPVAIAGGVVAVTAIIIGVLFATRGIADPTVGDWDTVRE